MATVGFSIRIEKSMRGKLEELARSNYRTLNGEINKALDFYIKYGQGEPVIVQNAPVQVESEPVKHENDEIVLNTNSFGYDEIEEF